ncbi:MAG TPA: DNA polymerase Y family protein, partial [Lysobacter sp.]
STDLPHAIVLEVEHSLRLFGPWPRFEARLREELRALGFRHRLAVAPNAHAARVLANVRDGVQVDAAGLLAALGDVPIERAGLAREVAHMLARMGLRRLRQVFALPRDTIARRFPKPVLQHLDALRGEPAPLCLYRPPERFEARIEFEYEVESSQALLFPLRRLTADLAAFLAGRDGGVQRFVLVLEHERVPDSEVVVGLLAPERDAAMLFELSRVRIEQARLPAAVRGLQLLARELPPFVPVAADLFDTRAQQAVPWTQLRERLRARLGEVAVHGIGMCADHRPERATDAPAEGAASAEAMDLPLRPGWLLPQPVPMNERRLQVVAGPERIESGWWDGFDVRRDYYLVETPLGQRAWAFALRDGGSAADGRLWLHGWFG